MDLWEAMEEDYEIIPLPSNPMMAQIKHQRKEKQRSPRQKLACLLSFLPQSSLTSCHWDQQRQSRMSKYEGDERIRGMQVLNLIRDFELQKMKETESIKEYSDSLLNIAKWVRLLGSSLLDSRIVEKNLLTMLERFEASITALENTKDLSMITLVELLNALQA